MAEWLVRIAGTRDGFAAIRPDIIDRLKADGVIWQDGSDWWIKAADAYVLDTHPEHAVCDFCGQIPVVWQARCADFVMAERDTLPPQHSVGSWAACHTCGQFIAERDRTALLHRAITTMANRQRLPARLLRPAVADLHRKFWTNYRYVVRLAN